MKYHLKSVIKAIHGITCLPNQTINKKEPGQCKTSEGTQQPKEEITSSS